MLILKDFVLKQYGDSLQKFEGLYIGDIKLGQTAKNIFKISSPMPYQFKWNITLGGRFEMIYGESVEDCRNQAIEYFRGFIQEVLR